MTKRTCVKCKGTGAHWAGNCYPCQGTGEINVYSAAEKAAELAAGIERARLAEIAEAASPRGIRAAERAARREAREQITVDEFAALCYGGQA